MSKNKKNIKDKEEDLLEEKDQLKNSENEGGDSETEEKEGGELSDGVLDAFDEEITPSDPLILGDDMEDDEYENDDEEDDVGIDSGDYRPDDEW